MNKFRTIWVGRVDGPRSDMPELIVGEHVRILFSHNSVLLWVLNSILSSINRFRNLSGQNSHSYFLAFATSDSQPPLVEMFSRSGTRAEVFIEPDQFRFFDPRTAMNTGYWLSHQLKLQWAWPRNPKKLQFVFPKAGVPSSKSWVRLEKDNHSFGQAVEIRPINECKVFRSALLVAGNQLVDVDPQQRNETYRREILIDEEDTLWTRAENSTSKQISQAAFIGVNIDFLFFEALAYGLPKLATFLRDPRFADAHPVVNDYLHPSVRKLWSLVLGEFGRKPLESPGRGSHISVKSLDVFLGGENWIEALRNVREEIEVVSEVASRYRNPALELQERIVLLRGAQARSFRNRVPVNFDRLVEKYVSEGFEPIDLGQLSISDQIFLMSGAREIVSPHGGSLAHLIWTKSGGELTEVFGGWSDDCFQKLAELRGLDYKPIYAEPISVFEKSLKGVARKVIGLRIPQPPSYIKSI